MLPAILTVRQPYLLDKPPTTGPENNNLLIKKKCNYSDSKKKQKSKDNEEPLFSKTKPLCAGIIGKQIGVSNQKPNIKIAFRPHVLRLIGYFGVHF